ncbi:MAG: AMP-binding protein, partial [Candidatus Cloacimonetes bacterium]|nr:AMP-binding protein [Candidatus Cloacimonadota bacterium]
KKYFKNSKGRYIGLMIPPSSGCMIAMMSIIFAGKIPVLINYATGAINNSYYAQKKCTFKTIVTSKKLLEKLNLNPIPGMIFMEDIAKKVNIFDKLKTKLLVQMPESYIKKLVYQGNINDDLVVLFTSGSEKDPKAVQLSHKNFLHNIKAIQKILKVSKNDIFITNLPFFHVFGLTINFWLPIVLGSKIITTMNPLDYKVIVNSIKKYKVSVLVSTPTFFYGYLQRSVKGDFKSIRYAIAGADKLVHQIRDEYKKIHNIDLLEGYGTTETSPVISTNTPEYNKFGSVGKPLPGVKVKVVDLESGIELSNNKEGKILIKGDLVMKGYFNDIEETSFRLRDGWYDTGDMGLIDEDGFLFHKGRLKRFVKIAGEMISLVSVEDALNQILPDDTMCCAVEIPDPFKGAEIVAVVTTTDIKHKQLRKQLSKLLPQIAIPKKFYVVEDFPMATSGKINFRAVEEICRNVKMEEF